MATTAKKMSFGQKLILLFKNRDFIISVCVTLFLLLVFRVISTIPLPGIKINVSTDATTNDFFSLFNLLGGGGLSQLSLFAVGVSPYISSQIIMQLLSTDLIPPLSNLAKSGELGRRRIEVITRVITLPFAIVQAFAIIALSSNGPGSAISLENNSPASQAFYILTMTAGCYLAIFIGDMISKKGVGNGVTLLILSGILAQLPNGFIAVYNVISGLVIATNQLLTTIITFSVYILGFIILLLGTTFVNISVRKIPIQQTGQGLIEDVNALPYLPIKLNSAGVIPVIFASSIMSIPITIAQFQSQSEARWFVEDYLSLSTPVGITIYSIFIILFTFFYSYIQINPEQLSKNFEKGHKFIPGIRPGYDTEKHISKVLTRTNFMGAPFLAIIAVIPYIISATLGIPNTLSLGGTGIVIMVSASIELFNSLKSAATTTSYQKLRQQISASLPPVNAAVEQASTTPVVDNSSEEVSQLW